MKRIIVLMLCAVLLLGGCTKKVIYIEDNYTISGEISVTFFDMKHGRATLVSSEQSNILIGCAGAEDFPHLFEYLRMNKVTKLDALIVTGGKAHDGGFQKIMANFLVTEVYVPRECKSISQYRTVANLASDETELYIATEGTEIYGRDGLYIDIISSGLCNEEPYLGLYISYGDVSFLMEGDGDLAAERELILGVGELIEADVLSVPHCGTGYLPSDEFIETVNPTYAIIPVYGDYVPQLTLQRQLSQKGKKILRTDTDGTVTFVTDGKSIKYYHTK